MRWCFIVTCVFLARVAGLSLPTTGEPQTTVGDLSTANVTDAETGVTEVGPTESVISTTVNSSTSVNSTETPGNVTAGAQGNSTDPQCKSDEKLIEDPTNCHVLCSKGALFYYSAGRKPNGTACVINKYLVGTKHIESSKPGDCFKGQCLENNGTSTTPPASVAVTTTISPTSLPVTSTKSSETSQTSSSVKPEITSPSSLGPTAVTS